MEEENRKGPWTEEEDILLVNFVELFGDRRWDFIAKVTGLNRTGKSCRLRWVNYLHPGLKRGKMTPHEERLVLELHAKWGNRWSKIARKMPGRTDNEIKNYWRTHMRKKAQEKKRHVEKMNQEGCSMDEIWKEIDHSIVDIVKPVKDIYSEQCYCLSSPTLTSPSWESSLDSIWNMDEDQSKMSSPEFDQFPFCFRYCRSP